MAAFSKVEDHSWEPAAQAAGPFQGLQGGGVAALMVAELETLARQDQLGIATGASVTFYKPTRQAKLRTEPVVARNGSRVSILKNSVKVDGEITAEASVYCVTASPVPVEAPAEESPFDVSQLSRLPQPAAPHGGPWMMDLFELYRGGNKVIWFKYAEEILAETPPLASVVCAADWAHGLRRPKTPPLADPNLNLQVVTAREPHPGFIGIQSETHWTEEGIGLGKANLYDERGFLGYVTMNVALLSLG